MPLGTKLSTVYKRSISRLSSALIAPKVRRRIARQHQDVPTVSPFIAYFADGPDGIYQLAQWMPAFRRLTAAGTPVTLLVSDANSANRLLQAGNLPIALCSGSADVENFVRNREVEVIFYVNNNQANFTTLRINGPLHVHLSHGESEKASMVSNQLKAYDAAFIAGPASRDRILAHIRGVNPESLVEIGRPQLDTPLPTFEKRSDRISVLYAPTWEGDSPSMAYSSLTGPGQQLVRLLTADQRIQIVFRPHPKTGTRSRQHIEALRNINRLVNKSSALVGGPRASLPPDTDALSAISRADVVVTDVSAMAMDSVGMKKPTLVLKTSTPAATGATNQLTAAVPTWSQVPDDAVQQILDLASHDLEPLQQKFREYVFGPDALGTGTDRFISAAQALLGSVSESRWN